MAPASSIRSPTQGRQRAQICLLLMRPESEHRRVDVALSGQEVRAAITVLPVGWNLTPNTTHLIAPRSSSPPSWMSRRPAPTPIAGWRQEGWLTRFTRRSRRSNAAPTAHSHGTPGGGSRRSYTGSDSDCGPCGRMDSASAPNRFSNRPRGHQPIQTAGCRPGLHDTNVAHLLR